VTTFGDAIRPVDYTVPPMNSGDGQILPARRGTQFWFRDPMGRRSFKHERRALDSVLP
jgi:hypothetical protein